MRKTVLYSFLLVAICLLVVSSCREKGLQNIRGEVKDVEIHEDTLIAITLNVTDEGDTMKFFLGDTRFQNGLMMRGDSVIVDYIYGENDTLKAMVVTTLAKIKSFDEPITTDTIITTPIEKPTEVKK